jgi:hypothetical protein
MLGLYSKDRTLPTKDNNWLLTPKQLGVLRTQFEALDTDNSGYIDGDELQNLSKVLGEDLSEQEVEEAMHKMDTDGDGRIDFDEFVAWWQADDDADDAFSKYSDSEDDTDRENLREERAEQAAAATKMQAMVRGAGERQRHAKRIKFRDDSEDAASRLQRIARGRVVRRQMRLLMLEARRGARLTSYVAALKLQSLRRGQVARRRAALLAGKRLLAAQPCNGAPGAAGFIMPRAPRGTRDPSEEFRAEPGGDYVLHGSCTRITLSLRPRFVCDGSAEDARRKARGLQGPVCEDPARIDFLRELDLRRGRTPAPELAYGSGPAPSSHFRLPYGSRRVYRLGQTERSFVAENLRCALVLFDGRGTVLRCLEAPGSTKDGACAWLAPEHRHFRQREEVYIRFRKLPDECMRIAFIASCSAKVDLGEFRSLRLSAWRNPDRPKGLEAKGLHPYSDRAPETTDQKLFSLEVSQQSHGPIRGKHIVLAVLAREGAWWHVHLPANSAEAPEEAERCERFEGEQGRTEPAVVRENGVRSTPVAADSGTADPGEADPGAADPGAADPGTAGKQTTQPAERSSSASVHSGFSPLTSEEYARTDTIRDLVTSYPAIGPRAREATIWIKAGKGLAPKDLTEKSDPYFTIAWGSGKKEGRFARSETCKQTLNPVWNEPPFVVAQCTASDHREVVVTVWDYDLGADNDFMGVVRIPTAALFGLGKGVHERWVDLETWPERHSGEDDLNVKGSLHFAIKVKDAAGYAEYNTERDAAVDAQEKAWAKEEKARAEAAKRRRRMGARSSEERSASRSPSTNR